jgi:hypothetical protein
MIRDDAAMRLPERLVLADAQFVSSLEIAEKGIRMSKIIHADRMALARRALGNLRVV